MKVNDVYRRQQFRKIDHDGDEINFPPSPPLNYINNYTDKEQKHSFKNILRNVMNVTKLMSLNSDEII